MKELNSWYKIYEKETVFKRAIPSLFDGCKPIHRKILFTALSVLNNGKFNGTDGFSGALKQFANYHHGDMSRDGAICNMAADFKNNIPLFIGKGNFGNRLEPTPAAARYTSIKLNKDFLKYMIMTEILEYTPQDDNNFYEPNNYYFSIPMVLVNGSNGIAVGLKTDILSYNPIDIKRNVLQVLNNKKQTKLIPLIPKFNGTIINEDETFYMVGKIDIVNNNSLHISEIPANYTQEKYISILQKLKEKNIINDYKDNSTENIDIEIKLTRNSLNRIKDNLIDEFKLKTALKESINVLSSNNDEVLFFESPEKLIEFYVKELLIKIDKYILFKIDEFSEKINKLEQKNKFIEYVLSIDIRKYSSNDIKEYAVNILKLNLEYVKEFLLISILGLTKDSIEKYKIEIEKYKIELNKYKNTNSIEIYKEFLETV